MTIILVKCRSAKDQVILLLIIMSMVMMCNLSISAQHLEIGILGGRIKKHHDRLLYQTPPLASGIQLSWLKRYDDTQCEWCRYWGYPVADISGSMLDFGDRRVLGTAYGLVPALHFRARVGSLSEWRISIGGGLAYLDRHYDQVDNPTNNAIGSHWNNITRIGASYHWKQWSVGGYLYHYSNGSTTTPNSGINTLIGKLGYTLPKTKRYSPQIDYHNTIFNRTSYKKWGWDMHIVQGFNQDVVPDGPTYNIRAASGGVYHGLNAFIRLHLQYEYEYNERRYKFYINDFSSREEALSLSTSHIISAGSELFFGKIGFRSKLGFYIPTQGIKPLDGPFYIKLEGHYYPLGTQRRMAPYLGVSMKSHFAVAQYIGLQAGVNI